jgi:hypothetical protein
MTSPELQQTFANLLQVAQGLGLLVCALFLCVAGFHFMTSGGSPNKIEQSKSAAFNAAVGFALVLSASVLANLVSRVIVR